MVTEIEYALMAGHAYRTTRDEISWIPAPQGWSPFFPVPDPTTPTFPSTGGFEAVSFQRGTEIVISYAGTYASDLTGDWAANIGLGAGTGSDQLLQAAEYYLQVKALNPKAHITMAGHSLGGGLAALIGVFFGETAVTFDQAPFAQTARFKAMDLRTYLAGRLDASGNRLYSDAALTSLTGYIALQQAEIDPASIIPNSQLVTNLNVQGEFLSGLPWNIPDRIGATIGNIANTAPGVAGDDLHSIALLTAFLQSQKNAVTGKALNDVTLKLPDLLKMMFSDQLFVHTTDPTNATDENLLERLVKHEAGVRDPATGATTLASDAMVTRFTVDLWKLAQDGGMTLQDGNSNSTWVGLALTAFAMQKYYEETPDSTGYKKELFTDLAAEGGSGGIRFDMADVSEKFATALSRNTKLNLTDAKGFDLYLKYFFDNNLDVNDVNFTAVEDQLILSQLPAMRDWFVQAGASGMTAADTRNRGDFMLGRSGDDVANDAAEWKIAA